MATRGDADRKRRIYLERVFERLDTGERGAILAKTLAVVAKWETQDGVGGFYVQRWRELLGSSPEAMRLAVMGDTPEAEALRHCMPFAGVLSNRERAELRGR